MSCFLYMTCKSSQLEQNILNQIITPIISSGDKILKPGRNGAKIHFLQWIKKTVCQLKASASIAQSIYFMIRTHLKDFLRLWQQPHYLLWKSKEGAFIFCICLYIGPGNAYINIVLEQKEIFKDLQWVFER